MIIEPVTLIGQIVRLEPVSEDHIPQLAIAGKDERIWRYLLYGDLSTSARMQTWVKAILDHQARGTDLPFAVIHLKNDCAIGATRYLDIRPEHRRVEIGGTWYCTDYQQTAVNTECKYMMLRHGFETWGCTRIQFKTDTRNIRSQRALERIDAKREGILRNHLITPSGYVRDSIYYSIIDTEWAAVKAKLENLMQTRYK